MDDTETNTGFVAGDASSEVAQSFWGFDHQPWHHFNVQKCIVRGNLCAAILSITDELVMKICPECAGANEDDGVRPNILTERKMDRIAKFCIFLIDGILSENHFSWDDATVSFFFLEETFVFILVMMDWAHV